MASTVDTFLAKYDADVARAGRAARRAMRRLFPGAYELIYDNYNALVFAYGPTERTSDVICSIALYPRWVTLFFARGAALKDPKGLLEGSGKTIRGIRLGEITLDDPPVLALIAAAKKLSPSPFPDRKRVETVVRSVSAKQRPRGAKKKKRR